MKILINLNVPAISANYDILVPDNMRIRGIVSMVAETVEELSNNAYVHSGNEIICSAEKNIILRSNSTLEQYGIKNGDHLVMI